MTNILSDFSLQTTDFSSIEQLPDMAIKNEHFAMNLSVGALRDNFVKIGQPYRLPEGRILWVTSGEAQFEMTLEEHTMSKGDIVLLAPETIIELKSCTADYNMIGVIFKENIPVAHNLILHPDDKDRQETLRMAGILWDTARRLPFRHDTVKHLLSAVISDIQAIDRAERESQPSRRMSRQEQIFSRFKKLVNDNCATHRTVPFYADKLALTPHYLSSVISKVSGQSVMYWINRATILQAKVLLKNKDMLVYEVAERLNFPSQSAFGLYFKRETGISPGEYQRQE